MAGIGCASDVIRALPLDLVRWRLNSPEVLDIWEVFVLLTHYSATALDNDGHRYLFYLFDKNSKSQFPRSMSAVYMFVREQKCLHDVVCYQPLYVGETTELGVRFSNHHKEAACTLHGYTHIFVRPTSKEHLTLYETALFHHYVPVCNDQDLPAHLDNSSYIKAARMLRIARSERLQSPLLLR